VLGLGPNAWRKGPYGEPYSVVHAVEHRATPEWKLDPAKPEEEGDPAVMLVFQALWPGDGPLAGPRMLREYDAQGGWRLHFFSDHARSSRSRANRLWAGSTSKGSDAHEQPASDRDPDGGHVPGIPNYTGFQFRLDPGDGLDSGGDLLEGAANLAAEH
jgi:hypothetical protein